MFPKRIGRVSFLVRFILFLVAATVAAVLVSLGWVQAGVGNVVLPLLAVLILLFTLFYFIRYALIARVRDLGLHAVFTLLIFIPLFNFLFLLALLFFPADKFKKSDGKT